MTAAGDVNGDGKADLLIDAPWADNNGRNNSGSVYVVFGKATTTNIDLAALGAGGYRIDGPTSDFNGGELGFNLDGGRDINGDGIPDAVLGSSYSDNNGRTDSGSAYVVFGKTSTHPI